jgi:sugar phosphate isomerase/epimerase
MEIGIFSKTFQEDNLERVLQKMSLNDIHHTQFNLTSAQVETMPYSITEKKIEEIRRLCKKYEVYLDAISGTFNMIAPNLEEREDGCRRFHVLCQIAQELMIPVVTVCTGSRNPESKWKWHRENDTQEAWKDLLYTTDQILKSAVQYNCILGFEIEASNIIHSASLARKYLDFFQSEHLKIIMDGANLFTQGQLTQQEKIFEETFKLVGKDIVLAHAKDLVFEEEITFTAAGKGVLDYKCYLLLLKKYGYTGALIMHGLGEKQVSESVAFLEGQLHELF